MRRLLAALIVFALVRSQSAQVQNHIPAPGTEVEIELLQDVSSETLTPGESIPFKLVRPVQVDGQTLLPAGSPATGIVEKVTPSANWQKHGAFDLKLQPLKLPDGRLIAIDFPRPQKQSDKAEKAGERTVETIGLTYYFPLIPVVLITGSRKGKPYKIRSGERYLVYVTPGPEATAPPQP